MRLELPIGCLYEGAESERNGKEVHFWEHQQGDCVFPLSVVICFQCDLVRTKNLKEALQLFLAKETSSYVLLASLESDAGIVFEFVFVLPVEVVSAAE